MSLNQCTLGQSVSVSGASLHTGNEVVLTLHPAQPGHGMKFKRADLQEEPVIDARIDHVKTVERATTLIEGNAKVQTVEHVLSALTGMGVDNCLIEMDASEPPIGDGSAKQYVANSFSFLLTTSMNSIDIEVKKTLQLFIKKKEA